MIRINLLGRTRPKATRTTVPLEATLQYVLLVVALVVSCGALWVHWGLLDRENTKIVAHIQRNRTGGQELLEAIANTVSRTDTLWLTSVERKGDGLTINGAAGSLNAVANYITQLKRSGYFQTVEIKESHQDNSNKSVQIFVFTLTTQFGLPQSAGAAAPAANTPPAARKPGKT
jgi:Tfp pilus assembly protein PilN